ncbi:MAG: hypothetical protein A2293_09155 [Elusimicrobia bacterium RIFOXYB2_FULL_49_7]|nr:MAG: hypothetical protein A2293_09155 [Elusimicrobia bacterium RIFOXYB2_FULL_49_7]
MNKKIVFLYKGRYQVRESVTIEQLSALARECGWDTSLVYDHDVFGVSDNVLFLPLMNTLLSNEARLVETILSISPDRVVVLETLSSGEWAERIIRAVKKERPAIVTALISAFGEKNKEYDHTLGGEPEYVFQRFLENGCTGDVFSPELADLNTLPLPDKSLFAPYVNFEDSYLIYSSKGCVFNCSYCEETLYKTRFGSCYYRKKDTANVITELKQAKEKYHCKEIIFKDSVFTLDKTWLKEFLHSYTREIGVPYKCFGKVSSFDEETAQLLKESGCYCVEFGVQTFNERIRKQVLRREETNAQILAAFALCDQYGLRYDADHMFGLPQESVDDHIMAAELYAKCAYLNRVKCHNLVVYPGTDIAQLKKAMPGDFFNTSFDAPEMRAANSSFRKFFKLLPLISEDTARYVVARGLWRGLKAVPNVLVMIGQLFIARKNNDTRFEVYAKHYPQKVKAVLRMHV